MAGTIEYVNEKLNPDPDGLGRCKYEFKVGKMRGKMCGLPRDGGRDHCFWHRSKDPKEVSGGVEWEDRREELEALVEKGAYLEGVRLDDADLRCICLRTAKLVKADLQRTKMQDAHLKGANLAGADVRGACLSEARILEAQNMFDFTTSTSARLEGVEWGAYRRPEEHDVDSKGQGTRACEYAHLAEGYRDIKNALLRCGEYEAAGEFYYREMECRRKKEGRARRKRVAELTGDAPCAFAQRGFWQATWEHRSWLLMCGYWWLYGYGERPWWVLGWTTVFGVVALFWKSLLLVVSGFLVPLFVVTFARKAMRG
jgi:hypothetical protein